MQPDWRAAGAKGVEARRGCTSPLAGAGRSLEKRRSPCPRRDPFQLPAASAWPAKRGHQRCRYGNPPARLSAGRPRKRLGGAAPQPPWAQEPARANAYKGARRARIRGGRARAKTWSDCKTANHGYRRDPYAPRARRPPIACVRSILWEGPNLDEGGVYSRSIQPTKAPAG